LARRQQPRTSAGLLPEAAHLVLPRGIASDGFPSTRRVCERLGIIFDPWQRDLNRCLLAKTRNGLYAADTALLSIPRQVGKTFDVGGVVFADSIINPGTVTVWTAHRFKVARETFSEMRAWAKLPPLVPHIDYDDITTGAGNECIPFRNGSRIVFAARERGAIRGFTKVRRLVLDEGQILTEIALSDLVPTMNQAVNPQIILMCTPPKPSDPSEVVTRLRADALAGESTGVLYVELSAPPGCSPDDRAAWRKANPSYPRRTPAKAILRMRKLLSPEDFMREALGVWDDPGGAWEVVGQDAWSACVATGVRL
jgi:phage terminase large subunit-like protein